MKTTRILAAAFLFIAIIARAQEFTEPGWFRPAEREVQLQLKEWNEDNLIDPESEPSGGGFGIMSLVSYPEIAEAITPEIQALARGLENDPQEIFRYVRDHIRYVHYFGSKKGAQLTLLERSGNDFDQCALLVALLRAAGHTASYRFGTVFMSYELTSGPNYHRDFKHWLGLSEPNSNWTNSLIYAVSLNDYRGFPFTGGFLSVPNALVFHHVWVRLTWNNTVYSLDPAFKVYEPVSGINLATAMGLDTNQLMTAAGGTVTANYVQNLSETNLRNKLRDYTTNFLNYVQSNYPNASVEQILGGQSFEEGQFFGESLPFSPFLWEDTSPAVDWDYIPTNLMTTLKITVDATTNRFLYTPQLQGQRLSLTFSNNGLAQLWLDDDLLLQKQTSGGSGVNVALAVDHPHGTWDWTNNRLINTNWNDHTVTNTYQRTNASYAISYAFEPDQEWLLQRQRKLDQYRQQGLSDTSREVVTETLNIMGLNWMLQTERLSRVLTAQQNMLLQHHHRIGRMAQEFGKGYYVDVYLQLSGTYASSGISSNDFARSDKAFDLESYFASAAEHGLIEQLQASNLVAASTIKMLQIGNTNGQRTYIANSANWSTINGSLSNYDKPWLKANYIDKGYTLLLPANGANTVGGAGTWSGYGIVARGTITNATGIYKDMVMLISGGYNGGYVSDPYVVVNPPYVYEWSYSQPTYFDPAPVYVPPVYGADPVSMVDGSFHLSTTDLSLGQAEPRGITLSRHYSSSRRHHNLAGMANGWVHSYYARATDVSAPLASLGDTTPAQMAPLIVATKAAFELYSTTATPKNWAVSSLIAKWGVDQTINNAVSVSLGKDTLQFIKQPNGTFTPSAGSTHTLLKTNGAYWVRERNGRTFKFNGAGYLTNIVDQYNQGLTVTYNSSNWVSTVKDWKNRQFTFNYSGTPLRLTSITDSTTPSRSASYGYTGNNLTSVTDPENKTSTFVYDSNHQIIATKDALNRVVVSNAYDGFGRVIEQYSHGDTNKTWRLYWSGFRNVEQDPAGGRKQYFYDTKRRLVRTIDAMGHYTDSQFDGQDHLIQTVSHLFAITDFYFDGRHNLIAINDPLGYWKDFFYDSQDRLWRIWDERGNNSYFGYNAQHSLTASTNNAGDWVTFTFNADGTQATRVDPAGTTTYGYDSWGQVRTITHPGGLGTEGFLNDARGDILSSTNGRGFVTSFQYDNRRGLTNTIAPTNLTAKVIFDAVGNVQATTDPRGFTSSNIWSATQKLLANVSPSTPQGTPVVTNIYDRRDWLTETRNPLQQATIYTNDAAQRLIGVTDPLLRTTRFGYDGDNRRTSTTNAANEVVREVWNDRSELIQVTDPANRIVKRKYDAVGNQTLLTNRNGRVWQFQFDAANRLTNTISPLNRQTKGIYNNRGLLQTVVEPSTETVNLYYDARGRLTNRTDNVGAVVYRYDANGNRTNIVEGGKTNSWMFDAYDRVSSYRDADGNLIQYRMDANGNVTNLIYPGGKTVNYLFDSLNRLTNVTDWANRKTTIEYDLANRVRKIVRPNGTVREMNYDTAGQLTNIVERLTNNAPIAFFKLQWNNAARVEWEFAAPVPQPYTPPSRVMTYDFDNRIATFNGNTVTHDLDGNMTSGPGTNDTFISYVYDARNFLRSSGGLNYTYDPAGNRVAITNGANVTRFVVNPNAVLSQILVRTKADGSKTFYVYGLGLLYEVNETSGGVETHTRAYHYDYRGSTVALTDGNGIPTDYIQYSAYGMTTFRVGNTDTPFLFNGRYGVQTDLNGLLYMRSRYYNPYICRFVNADAIGFEGGLNFYAYADGNPISLIDPFGFSAIGDYFYDVGQVFVGYGQAIGDTASGIYHVVRHPVQTAQGLYNVATHPVQAFNAISQTTADTWNSGMSGQGRVVGHVLITAATFGATKATSVAGNAGEVGRVTTVSRWGRPGLEAGDWVMTGPATKPNYYLSGKWDPMPWNQVAPFEAGSQFSVPASSLRWPTGVGLDGRVKGLFGQRIYAPDGMGLLHLNEAAAITGARLLGGGIK